MHPFRGLVAVLVGSAVAATMSVVDVLSRSFAVVAQVGTPSQVTILGIAGLITAFGGIILQAYDKSIARRKVELDHQYRIYLVRHYCDELCRYVRASREQMLVIRKMCEESNLKIPLDIGPPPEPPDHGQA